MLYPITLWLWAFLTAAFAPAPVESPQPQQYRNTSNLPLYVNGDSLVLRELKAKLDHRQKLLAPEKVYLHLDRTLYQPGETLWFNAYVRNAGDLQPALNSQILYVELLDPRGSILQQKNLLALDGTGAGEFDLPSNLPGGLYKIRAYTSWMLNTGEAFERDITLQKVVLPNLNLKLEFERKAYGPGDVAIARFDAASLDNKVLANQKINFSAAAGGRPFTTGTAQTDANGRAYVRFRLPDSLATADGLLNVQIEHQGQTEAISRPVPIVLNRIDLQFFPEGGDAVTSLPCRMAFKAVNEFGKPADVEGEVLDGRGRQVAAFCSYHNGMGAFDFVPQPGERYTARLTRPVASSVAYELPEAAGAGFTLRLQERNPDNLVFEVSASHPGKVFLTGAVQDRIFWFKEINLGNSGPKRMVVPTRDLPMGIARFTLFDAQKNGQAERLVFVNRDQGLKVELRPDKEQYLPRERVKMKIRVTDHAGRPVAGKFSLAVADEKLLTFADDKQGNLLASLLLEQDVKGRIEEPNFYFDPAEPKSEQALEYLLMTQGWWRFAWKEIHDNHPVTMEYPAEQATVAGQILRRNDKPLKGAGVALYPNGPEVKTDENGRFAFTRVDIEKYTHLRYWHGEYYPLSWYSRDIVLKTYAEPEPEPVKVYHQPAASGTCAIQGKVVDDAGEALIGATVKVMKGREFIRGTITDFNGNYRIASLAPGNYNLEFSYTGFAAQKVSGVKALNNQITFVDGTMTDGAVLSEVNVVDFKVPLIEQDKTSGGQTLTAETIRNLPTRTAEAIVAVPAAAPVQNDDVSVKGLRANPTNYYIDGIRVTGNAPPVRDMELGARGPVGGVPADLDGRAELEEVTIVAFKNSLIIQDQASTGQTISSNGLIPRSYAKQSVWNESERKLKAKSAMPYRPRRFDRAREFYKQQYGGGTQQPAQRTDFRATIYWNPDVKTDKKGEAEVDFYTSDAITNFRATLEGIGSAGQAAHAEQKFFVQKPVSLAVKVPASVISGDVLKLQIAVTNRTNYPVSGNLEVTVPAHFAPTAEGRETLPLGFTGTPGVQSPLPSDKGTGLGLLAPGETKILSLSYTIGQPVQEDQGIGIRLTADENVLDAFETSVRTLDRGFPARQVASGTGAQNAWNFHLNGPVEGTVSATLTAYPNTLEDVLKGMERMLRQPSGCFEQVSSSNYPNLLVLDLLRQTGATRPEIESRALSLLEDGYKKLTAYECKSGGFDWWGRDPAHEGLTAYGILEFTDMARVFQVDKALIDRTVTWLEKRRDGKGGWTLNPASLHGWQNDPVLDCYISWALAEAGYGKKFAAEIDKAREQAIKTNDPYQLALMANALLAMQDPRGKILLSMFQERQKADGSWSGATHSVMYATGKCFEIETTALAALALMKNGEKSTSLVKAMEYIMQAKTEYGYGSTQSTVLALKALVEYAKAENEAAADGNLIVRIDGKEVVKQPFSSRDPHRLEIKGLERFFTNADPRVEVYFDRADAAIPFDLEIKYASRQPRNTPACPLAFTTQLGSTSVKTGETVRLSASIRNSGDQALASPMIVLGIPAGLTLQPWQLKKLVDEKKCDFYELWDGFAVFHFENLDAHETRELLLDLRADIAGTFEAPASQAFLYYSNDQRVWSKPERLVVQN